MTLPRIDVRLVLAAAVSSLAFGLAACGDDDDSDGGDAEHTTTTAAQGADLAAIKAYLLEHTERLVADTGEIRAGAEDYYALAKAADFDYARLLEENRDEVRGLVEDAQAGFTKANPSYEEMEGVVAGVPSLAEYDVIIDAGARRAATRRTPFRSTSRLRPDARSSSPATSTT